MSSFQHSFLHSTMLSCIELKASISELYSFPFSNSKICQEREGKISKSKCKHKILLHIFTWNIIIMNFGSKHWNHLSQKPCLQFFYHRRFERDKGRKMLMRWATVSGEDRAFLINSVSWNLSQAIAICWNQYF